MQTLRDRVAQHGDELALIDEFGSWTWRGDDARPPRLLPGLGGPGPRLRPPGRRCARPPARPQRQLALNRGHRRYIRRTINCDTPDDDGDRRRYMDERRAGGDLTRVVLRREQIVAGTRPGRAPADVREVIGPRVHELQHVVPVGGVRHVQQQRSLRHVDSRDEIQRVVVRRDERRLRAEELARRRESVERRIHRKAAAAADEARHLVHAVHERIAVDVRARGELDQRIGRSFSGVHAALPSVIMKPQPYGSGPSPGSSRRSCRRGGLRARAGRRRAALRWPRTRRRMPAYPARRLRW